MPYVILVGALLWVGCWPGPIVRIIYAGVEPLLQQMSPEHPTLLAAPPPTPQRAGLWQRVP